MKREYSVNLFVRCDSKGKAEEFMRQLDEQSYQEIRNLKLGGPCASLGFTSCYVSIRTTKKIRAQIINDFNLSREYKLNEQWWRY